MDKKDLRVKIACQQILLQDASVYSIQWMDLPERYRRLVTSSFLLDRYYRTIHNLTFSMIRPTTTDSSVEFRIVGTRLVPLSFSLPQYQESTDATAVHLCISGGFLVQAGACDRGRLSLMIERVPDGMRVAVQLSDYCPLLLGSAAPSRLRKLFYRITQAHLHKVVTVRWLLDLYRELTSEKRFARVEMARVREGDPI